jgi:hypothetical protein
LGILDEIRDESRAERTNLVKANRERGKRKNVHDGGNRESMAV